MRFTYTHTFKVPLDCGHETSIVLPSDSEASPLRCSRCGAVTRLSEDLQAQISEAYEVGLRRAERKASGADVLFVDASKDRSKAGKRDS